MKSAIVIADEKEQGERALLNLGHTFCHALEAATGYSGECYTERALRLEVFLPLIYPQKWA